MSGLDDVMRDVSKARKLVGLSGAGVFLATRDDVTWFVRKVAPTPQGSERLRLQAARQRAFLAAAPDGLSVPRILDEGVHEGLYWFDMELVRGVDAATHLARADFAAVTAFTDRLVAYVKSAASLPPLAAPPAETMFDALYARVCAAHAKTHAMSDALLARVLLSLDALRACAPRASTLCHGDLTLENLVVAHDGRVFALDLLNGPAEHWWLDVAKLHQDLAGGWYLRRADGSPGSRIALGVLSTTSERVLAAANAITPEYDRVHKALLAVTFVRILPYVSHDDERAFVLERIDHFTHHATA